MCKSVSKRVLKYIKENHIVTETQIWNEFLESDSLEARGKLRLIVEDLDYKGLVSSFYLGDLCVVVDANFITQ